MVEAVIVLLFIGGIIVGWRSRFLWLLLSCFAVDMGLHIGLGFGINEVYIMAAHWMYVVPLCVAWLFTTTHERLIVALRVLVGVLIAWLWIYNGVLLISYLA